MAVTSKHPPDAPIEVTAYGFKFGAAEVSRATTLPDGSVVILISTPKHPNRLKVRVTKTGQVRVFFGGLEVMVSK